MWKFQTLIKYCRKVLLGKSQLIQSLSFISFKSISLILDGTLFLPGSAEREVELGSKGELDLKEKYEMLPEGDESHSSLVVPDTFDSQTR